MNMEEEKKMKKYLRSIERSLNMPKDVKERVMADMVSSIQERREAGQSEDMIYEQLGTPAQVAADLNEQMKEFTYVKSPWRWACLALAVLSGITMVFGGSIGLLTFLLNKGINSSVGIIGGADGPTAIFIATSPNVGVHQICICLLLLVMGLIGFFALSRCPRK